MYKQIVPRDEEERQALDEHCRGLFGDIPLNHAMIAWEYNPPHGSGRVLVIRHPDTHDFTGSCGLSCTYGACNAEWTHGGKDCTMVRLLSEAMELILFRGIRADLVHEALSVIPEYRQAMQFEPDDSPWEKLTHSIAACPSKEEIRAREEA